jgi:hypothetical protein
MYGFIDLGFKNECSPNELFDALSHFPQISREHISFISHTHGKIRDKLKLYRDIGDPFHDKHETNLDPQLLTRTITVDHFPFKTYP